MAKFPRTMVGGVSLPRLICGTNWFLGFSHTSQAKDRFIRDYFDRKKIADILEVFLKYDIDAVLYGVNDLMAEAIREAQERTGKKIIQICTPDNLDQLNWVVKNQVTFCFPHQCVVDPLVGKTTAKARVPELEAWMKAVRERGMIPGLSTHKPESIVWADANNIDVETYIQPYNAAGFLCQVETDWLGSIIRSARKPVITIKPLAAGRLLPPTGLAFVWSTIRPVDMVSVGTMSPYEAEEDIEISLALLEGRKAEVELQKTRSKSGLVY